MKKIFFLSSYVLLSVTKIQAQDRNDHLVPVQGIFQTYDYELEYYSSVRNLLFKGLAYNPEIRLVIIPSFSPENVLDISYDNDAKKYFLYFHIANQNIWYTKDKTKVAITSFKKEVSEETLELLKRLYNAALSKTKYPEEESMGMDGCTYYFSAREKTGKIWSPREGSMLEKLVKIGEQLTVLAQNKEKAIILNKKLQTEILVLTKEINNTNYQ